MCFCFLVCLPSVENADVYKYDGRSATLLRWGAEEEDSKALKLKRSPATLYDNG